MIGSGMDARTVHEEAERAAARASACSACAQQWDGMLMCACEWRMCGTIDMSCLHSLYARLHDQVVLMLMFDSALHFEDPSCPTLRES